MKNGILTTAQAADLLGVSVRTAQLWIEAGALPSWKTPGGHRRVRRADVETLLPSTNLRKTFKTALTVVITDRDRFAFYRELVQSVEGCAVEIYDSIVAAAKTISVRLPLVIVVDMSTSARDRAELLRELATDPQLGHTLVIAVTGSTSSASHARFGGTSRLEFIKPDAVLQRLALRIRTHLTHGFSEQQAVDNQLSAFPVPPNEKTRAEAVVASGLLDTAPEAAFDRVTWLATQFLSMPVSLITLLTPTRQWFKSHPGLDVSETPREWAFCNYTLLQDGVFYSNDLAKSEFFENNPAVTGGPQFRFYAGAPIYDRDGYALGSLCVLDYRPRRLDETATKTLTTLAAIVTDTIALKSSTRQIAHGGGR